MALGVSLFVFANWLNIPITDQHAYRQTQTAFSTYWMIKNGNWLSPQLYQTPIVGFPWRNPLEFPTYQWVVAAITKLSGGSLEIIGRLVGISAFYGCLLPISWLIKDGGGNRRVLFLVTAPLLISPLYLFWSRTFMIESTVLFLSLSYLACIHRFLVGQRWVWLTGAGIVGVLAVITKVTTFPSFALGVVFLIIFHQVSGERLRDRRHWLRVSLPALLTLGLCFGAILTWVGYCDAVKEQTVFGKYLVSQAMRNWNYGDASLRVSAMLWQNTIWSRAMPQAIGGLLGVFLCGAGFFLSSGKVKLVMAALLSLFLLPFLLFSNLHVVHNYYQYSASIFLVAVLGLALYVLSRKLPLSLFAAILLAVGASEILFFKDVYAPSFETSWKDRDLIMGKYLGTQVKPGEVLVMFGSDGSSVIPYYSKCRALTIPTQITTADLEYMLAHIQDYVGNLQVGAVLINGTGIDRHAMNSTELIHRIGALRKFARVEKHGYFVLFFPKKGIPIPPL